MSLKVVSVGVLPLIFAYSFLAFPGTIAQLIDPKTGRSLMERTIIICNTSSMSRVNATPRKTFTGHPSLKGPHHPTSPHCLTGLDDALASITHWVKAKATHFI